FRRSSGAPLLDAGWHRDEGGNDEPISRRPVRGEESADEGGALPHTGQAVPEGILMRWAPGDGVVDPNGDSPVTPDQVHLDRFARVAVSQGVGECFLQDPVDGDLVTDRERSFLTENGGTDVQAGAPHLLEESVDVGEEGLRALTL